MKLIYLGIFLFAGCDERSSKTEPMSTVDSNTIDNGDSTPAILHLDDARRDTLFTVALDSAAPSVNVTDTTRN
ncbi:MAG TPA: hypothetical protein VEY06_08370 [Flavisolibacter sp.]|nr:hypothetical protein [Flavisolibacter sp.]